MKNLLTIVALLLTIQLSAQSENSVPKFSLSFNPLGFVQFGPIVNAEVGLKSNLVLNVHARFPTMGVLTYAVQEDDDGLDELSGSAFGAGLIYFIGENKSKPYVGFLVDFQSLTSTYAVGEQWEWTEESDATIFIFNGGYRFNFSDGIYLNTGVFFGAASSKWEWEYENPGYGTSDTDPRSGTDMTPFGMFEVSIGIAL